MTYDDAEGVRSIADHCALKYQSVAMKNTHHSEMTELIISRDLDWL
jgi:hypothetical protein